LLEKNHPSDKITAILVNCTVAQQNAANGQEATTKTIKHETTDKQPRRPCIGLPAVFIFNFMLFCCFSSRLYVSVLVYRLLYFSNLFFHFL